MKPGDIVLAKDYFGDPLDLLIAIATLERFRWPKYHHCGIVVSVSPNWMVAADVLGGASKTVTSGDPAHDIGSGVCYQPFGSDNVTVSMKWDDAVVVAWAQSLIGKPYDLWSWLRTALFLHSPIPEDRFTCSSLVGAALTKFAGITCYRETTPDEISQLIEGL